MGKQKRSTDVTTDEIVEEVGDALGNAIIGLQEKGISATHIVTALVLSIIEVAECDPENQQDHLEATATILNAAVEMSRSGDKSPLEHNYEIPRRITLTKIGIDIDSCNFARNMKDARLRYAQVRTLNNVPN